MSDDAEPAKSKSKSKKKRFHNTKM